MKRRLIELGIVIFVAAVVIFFQFNRIPTNLDFDEVDFARLALSLDQKPYTPYSPQATGHATLYFYVILASFKLFGVNNFALRFPAAFFGVAGAVMFYFLMRLIRPGYAFLLTLILVTLRWYFSFARFAFEATFILFLELNSLYFLLRFVKTKKTLDVLLMAFWAGLVFHSYPPGRIFFLAPLIFLAVHFRKKRVGKTLLLALLGFILVIFPLVSYLSAHPDSRFDQQFFFKNPNLTISQKMKLLSDSFISTSLMFHLRGDFNGRHNYPGKPALNPLLGVLFILGLVIGVKDWKKDHYHQLFLIYLIMALIPTLFTYPQENPHMLRTFTVIPSIIYLSGQPLMKTLDFLIKKKYRVAGFVVILYLVALSSLYELRAYFLYQRWVTLQAFEVPGEISSLIKNSPSRK